MRRSHVDFIQVECVAVEIRSGDDRAAVRPPRWRYPARRPARGNSNIGALHDVDDEDSRLRPETMPLDGNQMSVRRPSRCVELRLWFGEERFDFVPAVRPQTDQNQVALSWPILHRDNGVAIRRQIRIEETRVGGKSCDAS